MDSAASQPSDAAAVERCLSLLKAKDDTSRFVGLTMLLALLKHTDERMLLRQAAASLDPRFLDRMLRSSSGKCALILVTEQLCGNRSLSIVYTD